MCRTNRNRDILFVYLLEFNVVSDGWSEGGKTQKIFQLVT